MMRPNKDVMINSSILILAIVIVIERIPSVDTGILPKDVGRQPRKVHFVRKDGYVSIRAGFYADKSARPMTCFK